jgi:enoyl-CoA hydratase/carnithine racemase
LLATTQHGPVLEIRLDRPPANALVPELVQALRDALASAGAGDTRALVLSGAPGMFSAGLDVPRFLTLDRPALGRAWRGFFALMHELVASPLPVAAAITGHAPAGGCVLAMCCDWRILASGRFKIGLNEVQVGVRMPSPILAVARHVVGRRQAERMCTQATLLGAEEALRIGLVDALAPPEEVVPQALAWCEQMLALPPQTLRRTRALARRELVRALERLEEESLEQFLDEWYSSESQAALRALVERLKK